MGKGTKEESDTSSLILEVGMVSENTSSIHPLSYCPGKLQIHKLSFWSLLPITERETGIKRIWQQTRAHQSCRSVLPAARKWQNAKEPFLAFPTKNKNSKVMQIKEERKHPCLYILNWYSGTILVYPLIMICVSHPLPKLWLDLVQKIYYNNNCLFPISSHPISKLLHILFQSYPSVTEN